MSYQPHTVSGPLEDRVAQLEEELRFISEAFQSIESGQFLPLRTSAPSKPREHMLVVADGTLWNPGAGAGLYEYNGGVWEKK